MKVLITGGAGFLGQRLARALLERGKLAGTQVRELVLLDVIEPPTFGDSRVRAIKGDIADPAVLHDAIDRDTSSIFHLAAIVSGMAESDFDLGMRINVDATRHLLEVCRRNGNCPRIVFTSSIAVYGGELPQVPREDTALNPQTSYGVQKAIGELLITDYTRKRFVDGRALRLPTISVRPGRPNAAASSFASGVVREPLNGEEAVCPVNPGTRVWLASPNSAIDSLIRAHEIDSTQLGFRRALNVPGISVTAGDMVAALGRVAGQAVASRVKWQKDARIDKMMNGWPGALEDARARALGFPADENFDAMIRQYMQS
jgi:nucleoside-diphosphate-sugar epimerase